MTTRTSAPKTGLDARTYHERVQELAKQAPKLTPEQVRKLTATFGGGPR